MTTQPVPIPYAYRVIPGHLLAGEHPGAADETEARGTLQRLLHAGITVFIDLTEAGEWDAYDHLLQEGACPVTYHRIPIVDGQPPSDTTLLLNLQENPRRPRSARSKELDSYTRSHPMCRRSCSCVCFVVRLIVAGWKSD